MEASSTYPKNSCLRFIVSLLLLLCGVASTGWGQTIVYPSTVYHEDYVDDATNALDGTGNVATLKAWPGALLGAGKYNGQLGLQFASTIPAGKTSFVRIGTEDVGLLDVLLGGTLGNLLTGLVDGLLLGNHHFTVTAFNGNTDVVSGNSRNGFSASDGRIRLIRNASGHYLLAITPNQPYNRIYIENQSDAAVGLLAPVKELDVYYAFHVDGSDPCGTPLGTSFDVSGVNLDLLTLGGSPADDIHLAIDGNPATYSAISPGVLSLAGVMHQYFYFDGPGQATDEVKITLSAPPSVLDVDLLSNIRFVAYNGSNPTPVYDEDLETLGSELLGLVQLDLLGLLSDGEPVTFAVHPGAAFDRFEIQVSTLLGLGTGEDLRIHEVVRTAGRPVISGVDSEQKIIMCAGEDVTLNATVATGDEVRWYDAPTGGTLQHTGPSFPLGTVGSKVTYYAAAVRTGCSEESVRVAVTVDINPNPLISLNGAAVYEVALGQSLTLPAATAANEDGTPVPVTWSALGGAPFAAPNIAGPFTTGGRYVYRVSATGADCTNFIDVVVNVFDPNSCPLVYNRVFANNADDFTVSSLLGIQLGSVSNPTQAAGSNLANYSLLSETVGTSLLGLTGETSQTVRWNTMVPAGTPVTIKLGREYGVAGVAGGIYVQAANDDNLLGVRQIADANLVSAINGVNEFEYTFIPMDAAGVPVAYNSIKISLRSLLNAVQNVRVYGVYYHQTTAALAGCTFGVRDIMSGFESIIGGLDVASGLTAVTDTALAIDGDLATYATMNNAVGANVRSKLDISFTAPAIAGDTLFLKVGSAGGLADVSLLSNFRVQRYLGNREVGAPVSLSTFLSIRLLAGDTELELALVSDVPFDRVKILSGGIVEALTALRVFEVQIHPAIAIPGEEYDGAEEEYYIEICPGTAITLPDSDCEGIVIYDAPTGGNVIPLATIEDWTAGTVQTVYLQATRFGCETTTARRALEIRVMDSSSDLIEEITVEGEAPGTLCLPVDNTVTLEATLVSGAPAGATFQWYSDLSGVPVELSGETNAQLVLEDLAAGDYTYYVQVIADGYCTGDPVAVNFTVDRQATDDDIIITSPITQCLGQQVVISPSVSGLDNPVFTWYRDATKTQLIVDGGTEDIGGTTVTYGISGGVLTIDDMPDNADEYFYVTVAGDGVCENEAGKAVRVQVSNTLAAPAFVSDEFVVCGTGDATFTITNNPGGATYTVYDAATGGTLIPQPVTLNGNTLTIANAVDGTYYVEVETGGGCIGADRTEITVEVNPLAQDGDIDVTGDENAVCAGTAVTLVATATGTPTTITNPVFNWYTDAALTDLAHTGASFTLTPTADVTYYVTVQGDGVCETAPADALPVDVQVNDAPEFEVAGSLSHAIEVGNTAPLPTITIPGGAPSATITWYDDAGTVVPGVPTETREFDIPGIYTYTAVIETASGCTATVSVVINVYNVGECPPAYNRVYATDATDFGASLIGAIQTPAQAADGSVTTYSTLIEGVNLLGLLGQTYQILKWDHEVAAGTPVSVKLGKAFTTIEVLGGLRVVAVDAAGNPVSTVHNVDPSLASALGGLNVFEYTFTPANGTGGLVAYSGIKVYYQAGVSVLQSARLYEAYYHEASSVDCGDAGGIHDVITGVDPAISGLTTLTGLVGVDNERRAVDGDAGTYATLRNAVGVNAYTRMEVVYSTPALAGDSVNILIEDPGALLSVGLLDAFVIQPYLGNVAVGDPVVSTSSLLKIELLNGGTEQALISYVADAPFDRIKVLYGGIGSVLDGLRVREITRKIPAAEVGPGGNNEFEICPGEDITLPDPNECTSYLIYTAATGGLIADITALPTGVHTLYVQTVRFGSCEIGERTPIEVTVLPSGTEADVADILVNGGDPSTPLCLQPGDDVVLTTSSTLTNPVFHWYDVTGNPIAGGENGTLNLGPLAPGDYMYSVGVSADGVCESAEDDRKEVRFTINPIADPNDIARIEVNGVQPTGPLCLVPGEDVIPTAIPGTTNTIVNPVYHWYNEAGDPVSGGEDGALNLGPLTPGNYTYSVGLSGDGVCETLEGDRKTVTFTINPVADADDIAEVLVNGVDGGEPICLLPGETVVLNALLTDASTITNPVFHWYDADGNLVAGGEDGELDLGALAAGDYTYRVGVSGDGLCETLESDRKSISFTIHPNAGPDDIGDVTVVGADTDGNVCIDADGNVTLLATLETDSDLINPVFHWYDAGGNPVPGGESGELVLTGTAPGTYTYYVGVSADGVCETSADDRKSVSFTSRICTDLAIEKTVDNAAPYVGDNVVFTIVVTNGGPGAATGVVVTDELPSGYAYVSSDATVGTFDAATDTWTVGSLANGASATLTITARVLAAGDYINYASVDGDEHDPDEDNNEDTPDDPVVPVPVTDLSIVKTVDNATPYVGDNVVFTIVAANNGPSDAEGVLVTDELPSGYAYVSSDATVGTFDAATDTWTVGSLANGASATLTITARVLAAGDYINYASVDGDEHDPDEDNNEDTPDDPVVPVPVYELSITKVADQDRVVAGETTTFTVTITNNGPSPIGSGETISLAELPSEGLTITNYAIAAGNATIAGGANKATVTTTDEVAVGGTIVVAVSAAVDADALATITNGIQVWGPDKDPETDGPDDDDETPDIPVDRVSNMGIVKVADQARVKAGTSTTFTVTVTNNGPSVAEVGKTIQLRERPGTGVTITGYEVTEGAATVTGNANEAELTTTGKIAVGGTITIQITADIDANAPATITNGISVWGPDKDPDTEDPDDEDETPEIPVDPNVTLSITKVADQARVKAGENTSFTLTITNEGPSAIPGGEDIRLTERPGEGVTITGYTIGSGPATVSGNQNSAVVTTNAALPAGGTIVVKVNATVAGDAEGSITNGISVWGPDKDPDTDDPDDEDDTPEIPVDPNYTLGITKVADDATVITGGSTTFTVTITNNGPSTIATGKLISLDERPGAGLTITGYQVTSGNATAVGQSNTATLTTSAAIPAGGTITVSVSADVTAPAGSTISNGIAVWGPDKNPDTDDEDDEDETPEIPVERPYTLSIDKVADQSLVTAGQPTTFAVTVTNNGPMPIAAGSDIVLEERPGTGVTITGYEIVSGAATISGTGNDAIITTTGDFAAAATIVVRITADVAATATGTITNGIAVWGPDRDPDTDDPDDEDDITPVPVDVTLVIPNLFTPNGDGLNDQFVIKNLLQYQHRELLVLNRWGNQVYKSANYNNDWDGGTLGEGTYYYILRVRNGNGEWQTYKGAVAIIRVTNR